MLRGRRVVILFALCSLLFSLPVSAQYYGAAPVVRISVEKFVSKPGAVTKGGVTSEEFVENLSSSDVRFRSGQDVRFKLVVKNTSDTNLTNVEVKDFVPDFLEPVEGPGSFNSSTRTLAFNAGDFAVNEEKIYFLKMRVLSQNQLPQDKGIICVVNKVKVEVQGVGAEDTSQFCIEKEVQGVVSVPSAGPEAGLVLLAFNALAAGAGIWLRRRK